MRAYRVFPCDRIPFLVIAESYAEAVEKVEKWEPSAYIERVELLPDEVIQ